MSIPFSEVAVWSLATLIRLFMSCGRSSNAMSSKISDGCSCNVVFVVALIDSDRWKSCGADALRQWSSKRLWRVTGSSIPRALMCRITLRAAGVDSMVSLWRGRVQCIRASRGDCFPEGGRTTALEGRTFAFDALPRGPAALGCLPPPWRCCGCCPDRRDRLDSNDRVEDEKLKSGMAEQLLTTTPSILNTTADCYPFHARVASRMTNKMMALRTQRSNGSQHRKVRPVRNDFAVNFYLTIKVGENAICEEAFRTLGPAKPIAIVPRNFQLITKLFVAASRPSETIQCPISIDKHLR